jgi:DNA polymerase (family X)
VALTLGRAWEYFERAVARLARAAPPDTSFFPTGGLRRVDPIVIRLGVLARTEDPDAILREGRDLVVDGQPVRVDAYRPSHFGAAFIRATGTSAHIAQLNARAGGNIHSIGGASEDAVYAAVGLPCIPPEIRDGQGEIERAASDGIPALISRADVRGDLHLHTNYSDGRDDVETVVAAAAALGYEYIAITDHSPSSAATRALSEHSLLRQFDEIDEAQLRHPEIRVLKGVEAEIMPDGSLDLADQTLERLDIVLASLHDEAGHTPEELLGRYRHAAEHPLVNVLTHPANQIVGRRPGYQLDYDRLFDIAAETGTLLEIDGAASHLDLEGPLARRAAEAGVTLIVDSDSHHARLMGRYMLFGVGTARRGWLEPRHVANTRPLAAFQAMIAAKRGGRTGR